jgi:hypothetical protein
LDGPTMLKLGAFEYLAKSDWKLEVVVQKVRAMLEHP